MTLGGQTKCTQLLKAGAAGTSGTVTEPFALQSKFPTPYLYVHYAKGASLVEAFYQSVTGPYQLLIVGDPLCQPFSNAPKQHIDTSLRHLVPGESLKLDIDMSGPNYSDLQAQEGPASKRTAPMAPARIAVQVDSSSPRGGAAQSHVEMQLTEVPPGYHDLHLLLVSDDPLNQRTAEHIPIWIGPSDSIQLIVDSGPNAKVGQPLHVSMKTKTFSAKVKAPGDCTDVSIWHDFEAVASSESDNKHPPADAQQSAGNQAKESGPSQTPSDSNSSGSASLDFSLATKSLGMGPVRLQARAKRADGTLIASQPVWVEIVP